jgi:hypothetical protein
MDPATIVMIVSASVGTITALLGLTGGSVAALGYINNKFKISYQILKIYQDRKDKAKLQQDLVNLFEKVPIEILKDSPQLILELKPLIENHVKQFVAEKNDLATEMKKLQLKEEEKKHAVLHILKN